MTQNLDKISQESSVLLWNNTVIYMWVWYFEVPLFEHIHHDTSYCINFQWKTMKTKYTYSCTQERNCCVRLFRPNETVWLEYLAKTFSPRIQSIILLLYILFILHPETIFLNLKFLTAMLISNWMIFKGTLHSPK